ncbi:MAG: SET domain-containing protein [Solirubrobacterales bacterium]|nr:SET domain-containing protein [Solirubrobacterales bacterium]
MDQDLRPYIHEALFVALSDLAGCGVFSRDDIPADTVLVRFGGRIFPSTSRFSVELLPSTAVGLTEETLLAEPASSYRDASDYINHSCDSNLGLVDAVTVVSKRSIHRGEELTCDYSYWEGDESYRMKQPCHCGSARCRVTITGRDWALPAMRNEIIDWASPYIRRRLTSGR